ncbi:MAG: DUF3883 domain-containing protein [Chloroflexota bacterium]|nr:DUF3883 domain-containing protein [Chloroflexota bacterium]
MRRTQIRWSDQEIEIIVQDYLDMLRIEEDGGAFNKSEHNRTLQARIGRSRGSIEYKHRNISAVMERLGLRFIQGYYPAQNFQRRLYEIIGEQLIEGNLVETMSGRVVEWPIPSSGLTFLPPPAKSLPPDIPDRHVRRIVSNLDPAARDARARKLGEAGENFLYQAEQKRLSAAGRDDLAGNVRWVSKEDGDGAGFDILSFTVSGKERWLEVKTTNGPRTTPFWLSANELRVSKESADVFRLTRLYDFSIKPCAYQLKPPLADHVHLRPQNYRASFR